MMLMPVFYFVFIFYNVVAIKLVINKTMKHLETSSNGK